MPTLIALFAVFVLFSDISCFPIENVKVVCKDKIYSKVKYFHNDVDTYFLYFDDGTAEVVKSKNCTYEQLNDK